MYNYKLRFELTNDESLGIKDSLVFSKRDVFIERDFKLKTNSKDIAITIRIVKNKDYDYFVVEVLDSKTSKKYYKNLIYVISIYTFFDVIKIYFENLGECFQIFLNVDFKHEKSLALNSQNNLFRVNYFDNKIKYNNYAAMEDKIMFFNYDNIIEILYVAYMLCIMNKNGFDSEGEVIKNLFLGKLNNIGIDYKDIVNIILDDKEEFIKKVENIDKITDLNELCFVLIGIIALSNKDIYIGYASSKVSEKMYRSTISNMIKIHKDIHLA